MAKVIYFEKPSDATRVFVERHNKENYPVAFWADLNEDQRTQELADAEYLVVATFPVTAEIMDRAPKAKLIHRGGIGLDNIDLLAAQERNIAVCNTPGVNAVSVAEMTIGLILALYRKLAMMDMTTKDGKWLMWEYRPEMFEMKGKTHGILGMGNIGKEVAKRSIAFGTSVLYTNAFALSEEEEKQYNAKFSNLEEILKTADIISVHVPLLDSTRGMIGEKEIAMMKPTAVMINVARGHIIDEMAMAKALESNQLLGAAFDAFAEEPPQANHPLFSCKNAILTPHIAGGTCDVLEATIEWAFKNIKAVETGGAPSCIWEPRV